MPEYLHEDDQGRIYTKLIAFNENKQIFYRNDYFLREIVKCEFGKGKIILSVPDLYQQTTMLNLIQIVLEFPQETKPLFLENVSNYTNFDEVVTFISKEKENMEVQEKVLRFILENPPLYKMLKEEDFSSIVDGCMYSQGSGDSTKSYNTQGEMIEIILEYAKKDAGLRQQLTSQLLKEWASYIGRGSWGNDSYYIGDVFESPEIIKIFSGEDLAQLFILTDCFFERSSFDLPYYLNTFKENNLLSKFLEAETETLETVLEKSTDEELNKLIEPELMKRRNVTDLTSSSQFFDSVPPRNADETADQSVRLHSSMLTKLSQ